MLKYEIPGMQNREKMNSFIFEMNHNKLNPAFSGHDFNADTFMLKLILKSWS